MASNLESRPAIVRDPREVRNWTRQQRAARCRVGFVPTMGALHEGHLSLVHAAKSSCERVVVSIFVNPTQFGPGEDLDRYPRQIEADRQQLERLGVDLLFAPEADSVFRPGHSTFVQPPRVARRWEGECRPDHFRGVATVVLKLFMMVPADKAFFGRKDYQQAEVIRHMAADLDLPIEISVEPTVRESDGLALSSRNAYLSESQRQRSLSLWNALQMAQRLFDEGEQSAERITARLSTMLNAQMDQVDYVAIVDPATLEPVDLVTGGAVVLLAARIGGTRLIDNVTLAQNS